MKKSYLVTYSITTRVIIDTGDPNNLPEDLAAHHEARKKLIDEGMSIFDDRFIYDNVEKVTEDIEFPYDEEFDKS